MADKVLLFDLDINVDAAIKDSADLRNSIKTLKEEIKALDKAEGDHSESIEELTIQMQLEQKQLRDNQKETKNVIAANKESKGSINALRAELSLVTTKWNKLSKEERENTEAGLALSRQKTDLTEKLKAEERATGDARRNVGHYTEAIDGLLPGMSGAVQGFKQMTLAALKFIATPVGAVLTAIVVVFKLLQGAFKRSLASQEKLNKITGKLSAAFNLVLDALIPVVEFILDQVITAFEDMGRAVIFIIDKLEKWGIISEQTADKVKKSLDESTQAVDDLASAERRLIETDIALQKAQLKFQTQAEKLRQIRDDESLSIAERVKANEDLGGLLVKQASAERNLANQALKIAKQRELINSRSLESIREIGDAEIKLAEIKERITSQESEQKSNLNSLRREEAALIKEQEIKDAKEKTDRLKEQAKADLEILKDRVAKEKEFLDNEKARRVTNEENELALQEQNILARLDNERVALEAQHQQEIEFAEKIGADTTLIERKFAKAREAINEAEVNAKLSLASDFLGNIAQIAGEGTAIGKAAAVAQTTVSTFQAAQGAYAALAGIPVVGPALGIAAAAAAVAAGVANVKKILAVKSGLPGDDSVSSSGISASGASASSVRPEGIAPTINQGIISRQTAGASDTGLIVSPPVLVENEVTVKQNQQLANNETAVI